MGAVPFKVETPGGVYSPNTFHLDYYAVSLSTILPQWRIEDLHAGDSFDSDFGWRTFGESRVQSRNYGITYRNLGDSKWQQQIVDTGVGCSTFGHFYKRFSEYCGEYGIDYRCSRVDFAFDVIMKRQAWLELCDAVYMDLRQDPERKNTRWSVIGGGYEQTLNYGTRKDNQKFFRIYNKTLESPLFNLLDDKGNAIVLSDDEFIIRFEVELKRTATSRIVGDKKVKYEYCIDQYIDYYYNNSDQLSSELCEMWRFMGAYGINVSGGVYEPIVQNKSFIEDVGYVEGRKVSYVQKVFGDSVVALVKNPRSFRDCLVKYWQKNGYSGDALLLYLANPENPGDLGWVERFGLSPTWLEMEFERQRKLDIGEEVFDRSKFENGVNVCVEYDVADAPIFDSYGRRLPSELKGVDMSLVNKLLN